MPTIIDGSGSATFQTPLPVAQGGTGGTTSATAAANLSVLQLGTAQATTSGTSIDFTGIPSGVKRITVMFNGVSTNGSSSKLIQIGTSGGLQTTGYVSNCVISGSSIGAQTSTSGYIIFGSGASEALIGHGVLTAVSSNIWTFSSVASITTNYVQMSGGNITLSGTLDRVRITTVSGTDTFDAGSVNIMWEF